MGDAGRLDTTADESRVHPTQFILALPVIPVGLGKGQRQTDNRLLGAIAGMDVQGRRRGVR
jgi:hypothetical protein